MLNRVWAFADVHAVLFRCFSGSNRRCLPDPASCTALLPPLPLYSHHPVILSLRILIAARDEEKKQTKALDIATAVTQGAKVLQVLELYGEAQLQKLTIAKIAALLIHADPQGNNPKPKTKKEGLERARALLTVRAALERRALAVAATVSADIPLAALSPAPVAPPPPPYFPFPEPITGVFRASIGSFESSGEAEAPTAHVGPDAL